MLTARWRALPDFVIPGAMKAGTSTVFRHLAAHPDVVPPYKKEIQYFSRFAHKRVSFYRAHFPLVRRLADRHGRRVRLTGEASPYYLFHPRVPALVAQVLPEARFVIVLRDPVERAWSHHRYVSDRRWHRMSFDEVIDQEEAMLAGETARLRDDPHARSFVHRNMSYLSRGLYADQLERWYRHNDPSRCLVVASEEYFEAPQAVYRSVTRFLGLRDHDLGAYRAYNRGADRSPMPDDTRARLRRYFRPHNRRLARLLGRELPWT